MSHSHERAWRDWGAVDPMFAILTDSKFHRGQGDPEEFFRSGEDLVSGLLGHCADLGLPTQFATALDFGCGVGRLSAPLAERFDTVLGLDIADSMITRARILNAARTNCRFDVHRDHDLRCYADGSFDFVVCVLVLQHLESQAAIVCYLREFARVLRPGGALAVQLTSQVPPPMGRPTLRSGAGVRNRFATALRRLGVGPRFLYAHLDWVPEMTMTPVSDGLARATLAEGGAPVLLTTAPEVDGEGTESRVYFATRPSDRVRR